MLPAFWGTGLLVSFLFDSVGLATGLELIVLTVLLD